MGFRQPVTTTTAASRLRHRRPRQLRQAQPQPCARKCAYAKTGSCTARLQPCDRFRRRFLRDQVRARLFCALRAWNTSFTGEAMEVNVTRKLT